MQEKQDFVEVQLLIKIFVLSCIFKKFLKKLQNTFQKAELNSDTSKQSLLLLSILKIILLFSRKHSVFFLCVCVCVF